MSNGSPTFDFWYNSQGHRKKKVSEHSFIFMMIIKSLLPLNCRKLLQGDNAIGADAQNHLPPFSYIPSLRIVCHHWLVQLVHPAWPRPWQGHYGHDHPPDLGRHVFRHRHHHAKSLLFFQVGHLDGVLCHICLWHFDGIQFIDILAKASFWTKSYLTFLETPFV